MICFLCFVSSCWDLVIVWWPLGSVLFSLFLSSVSFTPNFLAFKKWYGIKKSNRYNDVKIWFMRNDEENNTEISYRWFSISLSYKPRKFSYANRWRCNFLIFNGSGFQSVTAIHQFVLFTKYFRSFVLPHCKIQNSSMIMLKITPLQVTVKLHCFR